MSEEPVLSGTEAAEAQITVHVSNITASSAAALERALSQWAVVQLTQRPRDGEQLLVGSLGLAILPPSDTKSAERKVVWVDTLKPSGQLAGGDGELAVLPADLAVLQHEQAAMPPEYVRACDEMLYESPLIEDDIADAAAGIDALEAAGGTPATWAERTTPKRRRLNAARCFNCGAYSHTQGQCWRPVDSRRAHAAAAEMRSARAAAGVDDTPTRYFAMTPGEMLARSYPDAQPGAVSAKLAAALGMSDACAPPPWLSRMVVLGVPPAYGSSGVASALDSSVLRELTVIGGGPAAVAEANGNSSSGGGAAAEGTARGSEEGGGGEEGAAPVSFSDRVAFPGVNAPFPAGSDASQWQEALVAAYLAMTTEEAFGHRKQLLAAAEAAEARAGRTEGGAAAAMAVEMVVQQGQQSGDVINEAINAGAEVATAAEMQQHDDCNWIGSDSMNE